MKVYLVGGAVRDSQLGLSGSDRDWLVVGSTPEDMVSLGYQPVGKDFPVFLHPETREEYALARTERKTARGYKVCERSPCLKPNGSHACVPSAITLNNSPISCSVMSFCAMAFSSNGASASGSNKPQLIKKCACDV